MFDNILHFSPAGNEVGREWEWKDAYEQERKGNSGKSQRGNLNFPAKINFACITASYINYI